MNETVAVLFVERKAPFNTVIAYEQADIDWYRITYEYIEIGHVAYDTEKQEIIYKY